MYISNSISSNNSFSIFLSLILVALFALTFSGCDSPAGSEIAKSDNTLGENPEFSQTTDTDVIYNLLNSGFFGIGSSDAINNRGLAAGDESFSKFEAYGVVWGKDTSRTLGGTYNGYAFSVTQDINDKGQVVGHDNYDAILWEGDTRTELGNLGGGRTLPQAINEKGQVVGYGTIDGGAEHAFLWENGTITDLGTLCVENTNSRALAINERGQIVGWSHTHDGVNRAFLWENGKMTDLGVLVQGDASSTVDINDSGQIIIRRGNYKSTLVDNGDKIDLDFRVSSINNKGQILGLTENGRFLIWENGETTDITFEPDVNGQEGEIDAMNDLNDVGQVTGNVEVDPGDRCDPDEIGPECRDSNETYGFILNTGL